MPRRQLSENNHPKQHESTKSARRNYLKRQRINAGPSASQIRTAEARIAASQRAHDLKEKEKKAKAAKAKRLEKERREKETRAQLVKEGKLKPEDLLPKVRASQPRLSNFFGGLKAKLGVAPAKIPEDDEDNGSETETEQAESGIEDALEAVQEDFQGIDEESPSQRGIAEGDVDRAKETLSFQHLPSGHELEALLSSMTQSQESAASETLRDETAIELPKAISQASDMEPLMAAAHPKSTQEQVDAQLSSETQFDIGSALQIFEDLEVQPSPHHRTASQSPRKRKADELDTDPLPSSSKRPVFSRMSPSKVNVRAQEKPNPMDSLGAGDLLEGISTQDLAFSFGEEQNVSDKENSVPTVSLKGKMEDKGLKKSNLTRSSITNSFEAALQDLPSNPRKPQDQDMETDYGDISDIEDSIRNDEFPDDEDGWLQEAILCELPPTPSKKRIGTTSANVVNAEYVQLHGHKNQEAVASTSKGKVKSEEIDLSSEIDDSDLLKLAEACDQTKPARKKRRRIPWMEASQIEKETTAAGPSKAEGNGWDALEAMASTFAVDF